MKHIVAISGGKDSTAMALRLAEVEPRDYTYVITPTGAESICRAYCDDVGFCVTVTTTAYVFTGGEEWGVIVGLINYPRFPMTPEQIWARAEALANKLRDGLGQESFTIQAPDKTVWFSWREQDSAAGAQTHPEQPA